MKNLTIQVTDEKQILYKRIAEPRGSLAELMKKGTDAVMDSFLLDKVKEMSRQLAKPEYLVIQIAAVCYLADLEAAAEINEPQLLVEFGTTQKGPFSTEEIFEMRKKKKIEQILSQRATDEKLREAIITKLEPKKEG